MSKAQKHYEIQTLGESKLNIIKDLVSKSLQDGQISEQEFKTILEELKRYNDMKDNAHTVQTGLSKSEKQKLIAEGRTQALSAIKKR